MEMTNLVVVFIIICAVGLIGFNVMANLNTEQYSPGGTSLNTQNMSFLSSDQISLMNNQSLSFSKGLNSNETNNTGIAQNQQVSMTALEQTNGQNSLLAAVGFVGTGFSMFMNFIYIPAQFLSLQPFFMGTFAILGPVGTILSAMIALLLLFFVIKGVLFYLMKVE